MGTTRAGAECDLMNVRGNVPLTKVSEIRDREQVVMALVNNAMFLRCLHLQNAISKF